jgi:restriction endonuclease Mrr
VDSLINAKNRFNELEGKEPSYKYSNNGWIHIKTSSDFQHSKLFSKLDNSVDELTLLAVKEMEKYIRTLNDKELLQVVMLHLLKKGYGNITLQQKGQNGEFYLSYTELDSDGQYVEALALKCSRGNNTLTADDVALLRGRLSGFGAQAGFLITSGDVHKDAVDAGNAPNLTVITCIGANMLASILVKDGIGVKVKTLKIPVFDKHEFFSEGL